MNKHKPRIGNQPADKLDGPRATLRQPTGWHTLVRGAPRQSPGPTHAPAVQAAPLQGLGVAAGTTVCPLRTAIMSWALRTRRCFDRDTDISALGALQSPVDLRTRRREAQPTRRPGYVTGRNVGWHTSSKGPCVHLPVPPHALDIPSLSVHPKQGVGTSLGR